MKIGKKLFPYPTLNNSELINSYVDSHYSLKFDTIQEEKEIILKNIHVDVENVTIEKLLNENKVKAVVIIECSQTIFREMYSIGISSIDITIPLSNLNGIVEISSFIYATEDIEGFSSEEFIDDYKEFKFNIEKYNILAIDDGYRINIIHEDKKDKKISSIFSVIPNSNQEIAEGIEVSPERDKIVIIIPYQYYGSYDNMRFNDNFMNIFFGILAIPALSNCLQKIQDSFMDYGEDLDEIIINYNWFNSIMKRYKDIYGNEMTSEEFKELDIFVFAQKLLDNGSSKAIGDLKSLLWEDNSDDLY